MIFLYRIILIKLSLLLPIIDVARRRVFGYNSGHFSRADGWVCRLSKREETQLWLTTNRKTVYCTLYKRCLWSLHWVVIPRSSIVYGKRKQPWPWLPATTFWVGWIHIKEFFSSFSSGIRLSLFLNWKYTLLFIEDINDK